MIYQLREIVSPSKRFFKSIWLVEDDDPKVKLEKVIPDGYPEIIFHYGHAFEIQLYKYWEPQTMALLAGQVSQYFFLRNTGTVKTLGIKCQPWTPTVLMNDLSMHLIKDRVVSLPIALNQKLYEVQKVATNNSSYEDKFHILETLLDKLVQPIETKYDLEIVIKAIQEISDEKGVIPITHLSDKLHITIKTLERYFRKYVGITPKQYTRIIRLSNVFRQVKQDPLRWSQLATICGYYDQAHFIKEFKAFTGEEPSCYGFDEMTMANLFLN